MQGTLVFVHGTGIREQGFAKTWSKIKARAPRHGLNDVALVPCEWGEHVGPTYDHVRAALPGDPPLPTDDPDGPGAWALLLDDPLFELRLAAEGRSLAGSVPVPGAAAPSDQVKGMLAALAADPPAVVTDALGASGLTVADLSDAVAVVMPSPELAAAADHAPAALDAELIDAVARALVAAILAAHRGDEPGSQPDVAFDRALRSQLVDAFVAGLLRGVEAKGALTDWIKKQAKGFVAARATAYLEPRYAGLLGTSSPAVGDILHYQRRGEEIRAYVTEVLARCEPPVVAVGHSLGGVILVDLLSGDGAPRVDLLVTAGSQSPWFYAIDALVNLRRGGAREPFRPWLNIFSPADFLSFVATGLFGTDGIHDEEVDLGVPFPESHSAYWSTDRVYELITEHWPGSG